jgi:hypothetical protein
MKPITFIAIIFSFLTTAVSANDKFCKMNDLNGRWVSYQAAVTEGHQHTGVCTFIVSNSQAQGNCVFNDPDPKQFQGKVTVNKDCSASFDMNFDPLPVIANFQIQLHKDKESFVGRFLNNFGVAGVTNAVKR